MKLVCFCKPMLVLTACFIIAGCVSVREQAVFDRYDQVSAAVYHSSNTTNSIDSLDDYLQIAFSNNPGLRAAFDEWKAALERIPQARSLDDPDLTFEYFVEQMDTRYRVGLTQMFPAFGKLALRDKQAAAEAEAAMHEFEAKRVMLFDRIVKAFYEYYYLSRAIAVTDENYQLLADLESVVTTQYKAGLSSFSALIKVQVEKDRLSNELATLRHERGSRSAGLSALLNLPVSDVLPWPVIAASGSTAIDESVLADMLSDLNPELKAADSMVTAGMYREKLARKNYLPNFMIGAGWMVMPGMDGRGDESDESIMVGMSIPIWWGKYRAEIREADAMIQAAVHERDNMHNMLRADLSMAIFKLHEAERKIDLFAESLVPKAMQALEVAKQDFSSGKSDFMILIDAQRTLFEFRLMAERAVVDREIAMGEIGCCIGMYGVGTTLKSEEIK